MRATSAGGAAGGGVRKWAPALPLAFLATAGCGEAPTAPLDGRVPRDTVFQGVAACPGGSPVPRMDIRFPAASVPPGAPVAIHFHGGAWVAGERGSGPWYREVADSLVDRGWVVATASYRLAPGHPWPAQIHDARCSVRHLRARAAEYGGDPERIVVWGHSAGGHLASLLGVTGPEAGLDGPGFDGISSRVAGVVSVAAPTDLPSLTGNLLLILALVATFGTSDPASPVLAAASPTTWASPGDAPHLLIYGDRDPLIPLSQGVLLRDRLRQAGVPAELVVVRNGGHNLEPVGGSPDPSSTQLLRRILDFMDKAVGRS